MAKFAATDYKITINGATFSTNLNSVELALSADDLETTAFGGEWRTRIAGLKSGSLTLNFMQDFGAASIDATLYPLFGSNATVVIALICVIVLVCNRCYIPNIICNWNRKSGLFRCIFS